MRPDAVLRGRSGGEVTGSYPEVAAALGRAAGTRTVILDGEITVTPADFANFERPPQTLAALRPAVFRPKPTPSDET